jgi:hypothetical protein
LNPNGLQTGLLRVLERATAERPEDRMSAEQFLNALEELSEQTKLEQRKETVWRDIQRSLSAAERHSPWFMPLLRKNRSTLVGLEMGFHRDPLDRSQAIAEFLSRTVESCPAPRMSLNTIQARQQGKDAAAIEMIRALRNDRAHGERAMYEDTYRLVQQFTQLSTDEQRQVFRRAIAVVSRATRVTSLEALLEKHL